MGEYHIVLACIKGLKIINSSESLIFDNSLILILLTTAEY